MNAINGYIHSIVQPTHIDPIRNALKAGKTLKAIGIEAEAKIILDCIYEITYTDEYGKTTTDTAGYYDQFKVMMEDIADEWRVSE